jgi:glutamine cyclotransferase
MLQPSAMLPPMPSRSQRAFSSILHATVVALAMAAASVCAKPATRTSSSPTFRLKVVHAYPHDSHAFTQGLLFLDGKIYESTGLFGRSSLRRVDLTSGQVEQESKLPAEIFGEGLARVGDRLIQLTWKNHKALVWDLSTLKKQAELSYEGEGWGLCFDGRHLVMSDGSSELTFLDPNTFAPVRKLSVTMNGSPIRNLNELEFIEGEIWSNVWQTDLILRINPETGQVASYLNLRGILPAGMRTGNEDVLNGIAYDAKQKRIFVSGKLWPRLFEIRVK